MKDATKLHEIDSFKGERQVTVPGNEDPWNILYAEAKNIAGNEDVLKDFLTIAVLRHDDFASALASHLAHILCDETMPAGSLENICRDATSDDPSIARSSAQDLYAYRDRDPAVESHLIPFLYFKGFQALQCHRVAHWLWRKKRKHMAYYLQSRASKIFAVDIHPAVPVGHGVFIDHATGIVIGETAEIGSDVSILHSVTLGGTGKESGDRHPKVRDGVLLCAGAKVLGNIELGYGAKVGAGSVVVSNVPAFTTVVGVPARIVAKTKNVIPAMEMDQSLNKGHYTI